MELVWEQQWLDDATGSITVELHGTPAATCNGKASLTQDGDNVDYLVVTETKTHGVPWPINGKIESTINKDLVGWILSVQARVANRELADGRVHHSFTRHRSVAGPRDRMAE